VNDGESAGDRGRAELRIANALWRCLIPAQDDTVAGSGRRLGGRQQRRLWSGRKLREELERPSRGRSGEELTPRDHGRRRISAQIGAVRLFTRSGSSIDRDAADAEVRDTKGGIERMECREAWDLHVPSLFFAGQERDSAHVADQLEGYVVMHGASNGLQVDFHGQNSRLDRAVAA